jgi:phospholipid/cholesterol/gamma-HCH transport system substrate-binding protein
MNPSQASDATKFRVGIFTILGLVMVGAITVFVNDKPFWWRPCQLVHISVADATGLKTKSPIRSLGLQIGYLRSVELSETYVRLGICITAPVEVLPTTRAYIRGEGFLGDKFVELKPVRYTGKKPDEATETDEEVNDTPSAPAKGKSGWWRGLLIQEAYAEDLPKVGPTATSTATPPPAEPARKKGSPREIPVGARDGDMSAVVSQVDELAQELTQLTSNIKQAIDPAELRDTMKQLNRTLENASKTLAPEGNLTTTAQRTLAKLEDAIEQIRDLVTRVNRGEGSVGMLLNDPTYAEEIRQAIRNVNALLSRVGGVRFVINVGAADIRTNGGSRAWINLGIWPERTRYYLLGINADSRGLIQRQTVEVTSGGNTSTTDILITSQTALQFTAMLGKVFWDRLDLALGLRFGDAMLSIGILMGPNDREEMFVLRNDLYTRGQQFPFDYRATLSIRPLIMTRLFSSIYIHGGLESVYMHTNGMPKLFYGAGLTFDDEDIKLLFAFL